MRVGDKIEVGSEMYLSAMIVEPACEDHPEFLLGKMGEKVKVCEIIIPDQLYSVEALETNPGKHWKAYACDLMWTKPMGCK